MSALAEKMKAAGVDTIGSQLSAACFEAIRQHPGSAIDAWRSVGEAFGHQFIRERMMDMGISQPERAPRSPTPAAIVQKPYAPRVIDPERLERQSKLREMVRSKYMNSSGVAWSEVPWNELRMMKRDGKEAEGLLAACQAQVPTNDWTLTVGQVLSVKRVDEIIADVRARA